MCIQHRGLVPHAYAYTNKQYTCTQTQHRHMHTPPHLPFCCTTCKNHIFSPLVACSTAACTHNKTTQQALLVLVAAIVNCMRVRVHSINIVHLIMTVFGFSKDNRQTLVPLVFLQQSYILFYIQPAEPQ